MDRPRAMGIAMTKKLLITVVSALAAGAALIPSAASAWAPASTATIHPGVQLFTAGAPCTSNFIYQDGSGVYIGQAAHRSGTGGPTGTNRCTSGSPPPGTPVDITGAPPPRTLDYKPRLTVSGN